MNIKEMNFDELEARKAELDQEIGSADMERLDAINAELEAIKERKNELKAEAEERAKVVEEIIKAPEPTPIIEERNDKTMTPKEFRGTPEYVNAYVDYVKRNCDLERVSAETREILFKGMETRMPITDDPLLKTENGLGKIAVPTYVEERINTAWENDEIMRRVRKTYFPGNVRVGVEVSADGAVIHMEGSSAIDAEKLEIKYVELLPNYVKKMVKITHNALALTGNAFLDYLYDEIEYQLIKKCAETILANIAASELADGYILAGAMTTADIVNAEGLLGPEANDVVLITTRQNAAALKAAALGANYGYDPFDGLDVIYATMPTGVSGMLVDLSGVQANFPEGGEPRFIFDEYTEAPANVVRIVGRLLMGAALVATGKAVMLRGE